MGNNRRRLLPGLVVVLVASALALIGCSSSSSSGGNAAAGSSSAAAQQTKYPLTITEPNGKKAVIPKAPTRILVVDNADPPAEDLAALGVTPIGGIETTETGADAQIRGVHGITPLLHYNYKNFIDVGSANTADLEAVVAAHPDLIVGDQGTGTKELSQLEAIAPVVSVNENAPATGTGIERLGWYPETKLLAQVLNREAQFNSFVASFEAQAQKVRSELAGKSVAVVEPLPGGKMVVSNQHDQHCLYYNYLGLSIYTGGVNLNGPASDEQAIKLAGSDYLLMVAYSSQALTTDKALLAGPLFSRLPQVKAGKVIASNGPTFGGIFPEGPISELKAIPALGKAFMALGA